MVTKENNDGVVYSDTCFDDRSNSKSKIKSWLVSKYVDLSRLCIDKICKLSELLVPFSVFSNTISGCVGCTRSANFS